MIYRLIDYNRSLSKGRFKKKNQRNREQIRKSFKIKRMFVYSYP